MKAKLKQIREMLSERESLFEGQVLDGSNENEKTS